MKLRKTKTELQTRVKKGKDLSKLKAHTGRQKIETKRKANFSMTKRKQTKMIAQKEAERRKKEAKDQKTTDPGKSPRTPKPKEIITKAVVQTR